MIHPIFSLLASLQPVAPPAVVTVIPAPPPPIVRGDRIPTEAVSLDPVAIPAIPIRVRVTANGDILLSDTFRVGRNSGANYQLSRSEASQAACPNQRYSGLQDRYSLSVTMYLREDSQVGQLVNLSVSWQRPAPMGCNSDGSRGVQLTQTVPLAPGQSVTIRGDGGLAVMLSR